jgi:membrane-associated protein
MDLVKYGLDIIIHLDKHLGLVIQHYGFWTHLLLFVILFCETGLVITPFLPGDSLLFAAGAFAALGSLDLTWLAFSLPLAAMIGDSSNYWIGRIIGPKVFSGGNSRLLNRNHLERTHEFYLKYGGKTVIIAPFVAGVGAMAYRRFILYSIGGSIGWVLIFVLGGYFFGNIPVVKANFTLVILAIIVISLLPGIIEYVRGRRRVGARA